MSPVGGVCMYSTYTPTPLCIFGERPHVPVSPVGGVCMYSTYISLCMHTDIGVCVLCERPHIPLSSAELYSTYMYVYKIKKATFRVKYF